MAKVNRLWQLLETRNDRTAVLSEWRQRLGDDFGVAEPLLMPLDKMAMSYPNPNVHGLPLNIVEHADGSIVAVCAERSGVRLQLTHDDIVLHKLNIARLSKAIVQALQLRQNDILHDGNSFCIGYWNQSGGKDYPVYVLLSGNTVLFLNELRRILLSETTPGILLTPTKRCWSLTAMRLMERAKWLSVSLEETLEHVGGSLYPTPAWATALEAFTISLLPTCDLKPQFEFKLDGDSWQITYEGITKHMRNRKGFEYIHLLLQNTRKPLVVSEMISHIVGDIKLKATGTVGEILTSETIEQYRSRYVELTEEINKAEKNGTGEIDKLKYEMDLLAQQVKGAIGLGGRRRKDADDIEKMRTAVFQNIIRAIDNLSKKHKSAATHFQNSITTGVFVVYNPDRKINWELF